MGSEESANTHVSAYPSILKGREGKMNGQIIRYLALNGPSLIYSVAKDLGSRSQTKVHYPTVNRRVHELVRREYVEKAGTRITKAGVPADLYATSLRGDFAALAGIPDSSGNYSLELSPKELCQMIAVASVREGSPFVLFKHILEEGQSGIELVDKELVPEVVNGVRSGYLNIDALDDRVLSSAFASLISRKITNLMETLSQHQTKKTKDTTRDQVDIITRSMEKIIGSFSSGTVGRKRTLVKDVIGDSARSVGKTDKISLQWANELKVFLKLHSLRFD